MKKSKFTIGVCLAAFLAILVIGIAGESKYASDDGGGGSASAAVNFGPARDGGTTVKAIYAETDKKGGACKIYARTGNPKAPTTIPVIGATTVSVDNADSQFAVDDTIIYSHANGTQQYNEIYLASTTSISLTNALGVAGAAGDKVYEITQTFEIEVGGQGTGLATNDTLVTSGTVYISPSDSPVRVVVDGSSNAVVSATVIK